MFASLSEFEREVIRKRTLAGLAFARRRGQLLGRRKGLSKAGFLLSRFG
ncbi:recombinase family protein [Spirosoma agri]|uniref:Recombinase family protein n=1 Tax=Spirosoma agri TaxID=1987381 RepID=A0A6M0IQZ4_9BACT|nr:recombinase family protein [Spirosoma agri]